MIADMHERNILYEGNHELQEQIKMLRKYEWFKKKRQNLNNEIRLEKKRGETFREKECQEGRYSFLKKIFKDLFCLLPLRKRCTLYENVSVFRK